MLPSGLPFKAIGFDLDNTLIDRDAAFLRLVEDWLGPKVENLPALVELDNHGYGCRETLFSTIAEIIPTDENLWQRFQNEFPHFFSPEPAILELFTWLRSIELPFALLTNGSAKMQRAKLKHAGLESQFLPERILISEEIGIEKPLPKAFSLLAARLHTPPEQTLYLGDHPINDIAGAAAAGLQTCWIRPEKCEKAEPPFDFSIKHPVELKQLCLDLT